MTSKKRVYEANQPRSERTSPAKAVKLVPEIVTTEAVARIVELVGKFRSGLPVTNGGPICWIHWVSRPMWSIGNVLGKNVAQWTIYDLLGYFVDCAAGRYGVDHGHADEAAFLVIDRLIEMVQAAISRHPPPYNGEKEMIRIRAVFVNEERGKALGSHRMFEFGRAIVQRIRLHQSPLVVEMMEDQPRWRLTMWDIWRLVPI